MEIRPATIADVPNVLPMVKKICALHEQWDSAKYGFIPDVETRYGSWLPNRVDDPQSVFLVAEREGRLVAFLVATVVQSPPIYRVTDFGFIHDLWVEPEYRNEGIARQMTMLAVEKFTAMGVKQVRLDTADVNDAARSLFEKCGFRASSTEMLIEL
jgi:ribosomal protein S18 acetylase RimI-like enzyme